MGKDLISFPESSGIGEDLSFGFSGGISLGERGVVHCVILFQFLDSHCCVLLRSVVVWYVYNIPHSQKSVNG